MLVVPHWESWGTGHGETPGLEVQRFHTASTV